MGPDAMLLARMHVAQAGPSCADLSEEEGNALWGRLLGCTTWGEVAPADRLLLTRSIREVEAGQSRIWENPDPEWLDGDSWAELDRRREAENIPDDQPVPLADHEYNPLRPINGEDVAEYDGPVDDDGLPLEDDEVKSIDDGSWVGL